MIQNQGELSRQLSCSQKYVKLMTLWKGSSRAFLEGNYAWDYITGMQTVNPIFLFLQRLAWPRRFEPSRPRGCPESSSWCKTRRKSCSSARRRRRLRCRGWRRQRHSPKSKIDLFSLSSCYQLQFIPSTMKKHMRNKTTTKITARIMTEADEMLFYAEFGRILHAVPIELLTSGLFQNPLTRVQALPSLRHISCSVVNLSSHCRVCSFLLYTWCCTWQFEAHFSNVSHFLFKRYKKYCKEKSSTESAKLKSVETDKLKICWGLKCFVAPSFEWLKLHFFDFSSGLNCMRRKRTRNN